MALYPNYSQINNPYQQINPYGQQMINPYMDRIMGTHPSNIQQMQPSNIQMAQQNQPAGITGKVIQAVEQVNANDVPMDGSVAFFPKQDLSEIYAKQWNADGTIKTVVYKPIQQSSINSQGNVQNAQISMPEELTQAFMSRFDGIESKLSELEQFMTKPIAKTKNSIAKKDGESE